VASTPILRSAGRTTCYGVNDASPKGMCETHLYDSSSFTTRAKRHRSKGGQGIKSRGKREGSVERHTRGSDPRQPTPQFDGKIRALMELLCSLKDDRSDICQRVKSVEQHEHKHGIEWCRSGLDAKADLAQRLAPVDYSKLAHERRVFSEMRQTSMNADFVPCQEGCTGEKTRRVGGAKLSRGFTQLEPMAAEDDGSGDVVEVSTDKREIVELKEPVVRVAPRL
jgi:hypothetical protein